MLWSQKDLCLNLGFPQLMYHLGKLFNFLGPQFPYLQWYKYLCHRIVTRMKRKNVQDSSCARPLQVHQLSIILLSHYAKIGIATVHLLCQPFLSFKKRGMSLKTQSRTEQKRKIQIWPSSFFLALSYCSRFSLYFPYVCSRISHLCKKPRHLLIAKGI